MGFYWRSSEINTFNGNLKCGINVQFKDEKTKDLWYKLHKKKCVICKNKKDNIHYESTTIKTY